MLPMLSKGLGTDAQKPRYWGMTQGSSCLQGKQFFKVSIKSLVSMLPMLSKGLGTDAQKPRY